MGQTLSCPPGFEKGALFTCHASCPARFKYAQETGGGTGPPVSKCVHAVYNQFFFNLTTLPQLETTDEVPSTYTTEKERIQTEVMRVDKSITELEALHDVGKQRTKYVDEYSRIESNYSEFKDANAAVDKLKEINDSLKPMRAPTAPSSDLEKERKAILSIATRDLFFVQFSLFLLVLVFLSYLTLPTDTAHVLAFLLLSVGVSIGFFLTR
jgi:hypothetical protein